jgi:hypothetical protein
MGRFGVTSGRGRALTMREVLVLARQGMTEGIKQAEH